MKSKHSDNEHVIMQMRKNVSLNGSKPIVFANGDTETVPSHHASKALDFYNSLKPSEKQLFQAHINKSHREFTDWIGGKKFTPGETSKPKDTRGINNDEIFGNDRPRESSTLRTIKSLRHRRSK